MDILVSRRLARITSRFRRPSHSCRRLRATRTWRPSPWASGPAWCSSQPLPSCQARKNATRFEMVFVYFGCKKCQTVESLKNWNCREQRFSTDGSRPGNGSWAELFPTLNSWKINWNSPKNLKNTAIKISNMQKNTIYFFFVLKVGSTWPWGRLKMIYFLILLNCGSRRKKMWKIRVAEQFGLRNAGLEHGWATLLAPGPHWKQI